MTLVIDMASFWMGFATGGVILAAVLTFAVLISGV